MTARVTARCRRCGRAAEHLLEEGVEAAPCRHCGAALELRADALAGGRLVRCPVCGLKVLYRQKDFRQAVGCGIVLLAAVLAPFTWYLSLVAAAALDLLLYWISRDVLICYRVDCKAQVRGVPPGPLIGAFDLSVHDYYRGLQRDGVDATQAEPPRETHSH